ncbi:nucleotidyl transferase AbiEii/AbiGii toxin family protein [Pantoea phytobeneficialis]|uniref:Nucleotidyl transferase AbiEii/AbiGii toxin family protein n=1 Tax=Pantoea phytobeneficialis TaxID=2052056 RepID=A0ABT8XTN8_9GAMM|nr:nucleotidyl transferase AbiEii/AbiGii toxin family protein [Pantoea phytobeneficialis]MDO6406824.1 nucleotidyl transferase AbiEii/AbiGii toxin family protein [Pantoea phytobeneficialis]
MNNAYKKQVQLLLDVLPEVAKEKCLAMHGGTAINLFLRNMPRLSVDIDLTYIDIAERATSLTAINDALIRIQKNIIGLRNTMHFQHRSDV